MGTSVYLVRYDGLLVKTTKHKLSLCLYLCCYCVKKKLKSSRSRPCLSGCFHSALSYSVSFVPH